jgi:hypothetical protein
MSTVPGPRTSRSGRTFSSAWKPRLALWVNYASGDRDAS